MIFKGQILCKRDFTNVCFLPYPTCDVTKGTDPYRKAIVLAGGQKCLAQRYGDNFILRASSMDSGGNNDRNCVLYGTFNTYSVLFNIVNI